MDDKIEIDKEKLYRMIDSAIGKWDCNAVRAAFREFMTMLEIHLETTDKNERKSI